MVKSCQGRKIEELVRLMMQEVARHLQIYAHGDDTSDKDAFARSAYNRYYYACYLLARSYFAKMNDKWEEAPHKNYPEILKGTIQKKLKFERGRANRNGDKELTKIIDLAMRAIPELCTIMTEAYAARVVADYQPNTLVVFNADDRFSLNSVKISTAHNWLSRIQILFQSVFKAWQQINA